MAGFTPNDLLPANFCPHLTDGRAVSSRVQKTGSEESTSSPLARGWSCASRPHTRGSRWLPGEQGDRPCGDWPVADLMNFGGAKRGANGGRTASKRVEVAVPGRG